MYSDIADCVVRYAQGIRSRVGLSDGDSDFLGDYWRGIVLGLVAYNTSQIQYKLAGRLRDAAADAQPHRAGVMDSVQRNATYGSYGRQSLGRILNADPYPPLLASNYGHTPRLEVPHLWGLLLAYGRVYPGLQRELLLPDSEVLRIQELSGFPSLHWSTLSAASPTQVPPIRYRRQIY